MSLKKEIIIAVAALVIVYIPMTVALVMNIKDNHRRKLGSIIFWAALTVAELVAMAAGKLSALSIRNMFFLIWLMVFTTSNIIKYIKQKKPEVF